MVIKDNDNILEKKIKLLLSFPFNAHYKLKKKKLKI